MGSKKELIKKSMRAIRLSIILIISMLMLVGCNNKAKLRHEEVKMKEYLEEKYAKEFVIMSSEIEWKQLGGSKYFVAKVYPKDDKEVVFEIRRGIDSIGYGNTYLERLWEKEEKIRVEKFLATLFEKVPEVDIFIYAEEELVDGINGYVPNFNEIVDKAGEDIDVSVTIEVSDTFNEVNRIKHAKNILKIAAFMNKKVLKDFYVSYYVLQDSTKYHCTMDKKDIEVIKDANELKFLKYDK